MTDQMVLQIEVRKEIDGIEMGVLSDGTSFLSMRALSKMCGIANSTISETAAAWRLGRRDSKLAQWLQRNGLSAESLYIETDIPGVAGNKIYAFPEEICTLVLEYYAFESPSPTENAIRNFRLTARAGLRVFIYKALGYAAGGDVPLPWREFHDRLVLHATPAGHFSVFREMADFILSSIRVGLRVDHKTVPDISVGKAWSNFWTKNNLANKHGERHKFEHNYPDYFPQAKSNPQDMWVYPVSALGEFRTWMNETYVPETFPGYLAGKVKQGLLTASTAELLLAEVADVPELPAAG